MGGCGYVPCSIELSGDCFCYQITPKTHKLGRSRGRCVSKRLMGSGEVTKWVANL